MRVPAGRPRIGAAGTEYKIRGYKAVLMCNRQVETPENADFPYRSTERPTQAQNQNYTGNCCTSTAQTPNEGTSQLLLTGVISHRLVRSELNCVG